MQKVRLAAVLLGAALMTTGCGDGVQRLDGQAAPAGAGGSHSVATSSSIAPPTTPATSTAPAARSASARPTSTTAKPPGSATLVLGPRGLGSLRLGMSRQEAEATGMIVGYEVENFTGNCGMSKLRGTNVTVYFTPGVGVSNIPLYGDIRTAEGIRLGSSVSALKKAYPDWELIVGEGGNGYGWVDTPGNSQASYRIDLRDGKVSYLALSIAGQKCIE